MEPITLTPNELSNNSVPEKTSDEELKESEKEIENLEDKHTHSRAFTKNIADLLHQSRKLECEKTLSPDHFSKLVKRLNEIDKEMPDDDIFAPEPSKSLVSEDSEYSEYFNMTFETRDLLLGLFSTKPFKDVEPFIQSLKGLQHFNMDRGEVEYLIPLSVKDDIISYLENQPHGAVEHFIKSIESCHDSIDN